MTLLEVMLSVAIIIVLAGSSVPVSNYFQNKNEVDAERNAIVSSLRRAQALAQDMSGDSAWGVKIELGKVTLFQGNDYNSRNDSFDEIFDFSETIIPSGINEIVFSKIWGEPNISGIINLMGPNNETSQIQINTKGMIDY
ncbi:MAG: type II secretion system protein [Candidatus Paceibacterota bacterium]|jgi:type II secretory pathway pseudopilin PulG